MSVCVLFTLFCCLMLSGVQSQSRPSLKCITPRATPVKVFVNGRRNQTGHWISQVVVQQRRELQSPGVSVSQDQWLVDVEHRVDYCEGVESASNIVLTFTAPPLKASPGYELFAGLGSYKYHGTGASWPSARQICAEEGAHLIIVNSEKEYEVVKTIYNRKPTRSGVEASEWVWVGINEHPDGVYNTVFGISLNSTGYNKWFAANPNEAAPDNCLLVHTVTGGHNDVVCSRKFAFICEQEFV